MSQDPLADFYLSQLGMPQAYTGAMESLGFRGNPYGSQQQNFEDVANWQQSFKGIMDNIMKAWGTNNAASLPYNTYNMMTTAAPIYQDPEWGPGANTQANMFGGNGSDWKQGLDFGPNSWRSNRYQQYIDRINAPPPPALSSMSTTPGLGTGTSTIPNYAQEQTRHPSATSFTVGLEGGGSQTVNAHDLASALANVQGNSGRVEKGGYRF